MVIKPITVSVVVMFAATVLTNHPLHKHMEVVVTMRSGRFVSVLLKHTIFDAFLTIFFYINFFHILFILNMNS